MSVKSIRHLLEAIEQCQLNKIIYLVKHGHNIHIKNKVGQNFLVYILKQQRQDSSLSKKRFRIFQFLITNYNLNIQTLDFYGKNLFNWATNLNCTQEALYLLNSYPGDIDILARDQSGSCSLHYAVEHGNEILVHAIANYLLHYRLRFDIKDAYNNTPEDLAKKLGYDKISHFLAQACRSTVFMSREIQQPPMISKSKTTASLSDYFNLIETRIDTAKMLSDWKTVVALRALKRNTNEKILDPIPQINTRASPVPPTKLPPINTTSHSAGQAEQILRLTELQLSSSFRRSFVPVYPHLINRNVSFPRISNGQRKLSQIPSPRISSVLGLRKRNSDASQVSIPTLQNLQNRFSLPPVYKQYRQALATTR